MEHAAQQGQLQPSEGGVFWPICIWNLVWTNRQMEEHFCDSAAAHSLLNVYVFPRTYSTNRVPIRVCNRDVEMEVPPKIPSSHGC